MKAIEIVNGISGLDCPDDLYSSLDLLLEIGLVRRIFNRSEWAIANCENNSILDHLLGSSEYEMAFDKKRFLKERQNERDKE